jgi:cell division protein FtsL
MKALSGCSLQNEANERIAIDITTLTQIIMVVAIISISSVYASIYPVGNACQGITGKIRKLESVLEEIKRLDS